MVEKEKTCTSCEEAVKGVVRLAVDDPARPSNRKEILSFMHCGLCVMEFKKLREEGKTEGMSPGDYQRVEVGSTPAGLQVWCRRHDVNIIHVDFEGEKMTANMTRAASPH